MDDIWTLLSFGPGGWGGAIASGTLVTISLAVATLPIGLAIGFFVALAKNSDEPSLQAAANIYTTLFRGMPELLTLFIVYYGGQMLAQKLLALIGLPGVEINSFVAGLIALSVVFSSYSSEVILSAFKGVASGQYEGGYSVGLTRTQTLRLIVVPQLVRLALPGLSNLWLSLIKDTSLVSVVGLVDVLRQTGIAAKTTKHAFLFFGVACAIYLVLSVLSSFGLNWIERWTRRGEARQ